jgi:hypothetical protein
MSYTGPKLQQDIVDILPRSRVPTSFRFYCQCRKSLLRLNQPSPPLRQTDHFWAITNHEKVNIFVEYLSK